MRRLLAVIGFSCLSCTKSASPTPAATSAVAEPPRVEAPLPAPPAEPAANSPASPLALASGEAQPMPDTSPWVIEFSGAGRAKLVNHSGAAALVLHDALLQPSRLELSSADGKPLAPEDTRAVKKFDQNAYEESFQSVPAGGELALFELEVTASGDSFELAWGPFRFHAVPRGHYRARVSFESVRKEYVDPETRRSRELPGVWLGSAKSSLVTLSIPP